MSVVADREPVSIASKSLERVKQVILEHLAGQDVTVVLFGSRSTGEGHRRSDIDIGMLPGENFDRAHIHLVEEALEALNIPYRIDLVDLSRTSELFRNKVLQEGVVWERWKC